MSSPELFLPDPLTGGSGRLYGAFFGAPVYFFAQDVLAKSNPMFWLFWLGLILIGIVMFARGGILGIIDTLITHIHRLYRLVPWRVRSETS